MTQVNSHNDFAIVNIVLVLFFIVHPAIRVWILTKSLKHNSEEVIYSAASNRSSNDNIDNNSTKIAKYVDLSSHGS